VTERKAGEILKVTPRNEGTKGRIERTDDGGYSVEPPLNSVPTLAEIGVTKKESSRFQKMASLPDDKFEEAALAADQPKMRHASANGLHAD
jgi:hypothetical protein